MPSTWRIWLIRALLVTFAGLFHGASWAYPGWWPGTWIGQCLLAILAVQCRPRTAFLLGLVVGCIGLGWAFDWAPASLRLTMDATWLGSWALYGFLVLWESAVFGVFCGVTSRFAVGGFERLALAPFVWVVAEFWWPRIFPWFLGYSQLEFLPLVQIAEITGSCGVGFAITAACVLPAAWIRWRRENPPQLKGIRLWQFQTAIVLLFLGVLLFGQMRLSYWRNRSVEGPGLKVGVIQVDPTRVGSEAKLRARSLDVSNQVDLVCWPESAIGNYCCDLQDFTDTHRTLAWSRDSRESIHPAADLNCDLLAGGKTYPRDASESGPYSMTAFLVSPEEKIIGRYRKRTLLPFGEYMPGQNQFPQLREWATLSDYIEPGDDARPLVTSGGKRIGVVICYEDMLANNVHASIVGGAEVLFSLINGAAFETPRTLIQHHRLALMRAVEHRRFFVRCASTGLTCVIAPTGEVIQQLPLHVEGSLVAEIKLLSESTVYSICGNYFPWFCSGVSFVALALAHLRESKECRARLSAQPCSIQVSTAYDGRLRHEFQ